MAVVLYVLACAGLHLWPVTYAKTVNNTVELASLYNHPSDKFWYAVQKVETGGEPDPLSAVGDGGDSIGPLQIQRAYYNDALQFDPSLQSGQYTGYMYQNCMGSGSFEYSKKVGNAYMGRYATVGRLGHVPTNEDYARIHNGGPNGWRRDSTKAYAAKVLAYLNKM